MPTKATLVDVCLLDEREKVLRAPLVSAAATKWLRAQRRLRGVLRLRNVSTAEAGDGSQQQQHREWTLHGFRSEVGRMLGRDDVTWILDKQVGRNDGPKHTRTHAHATKCAMPKVLFSHLLAWPFISFESHVLFHSAPPPISVCTTPTEERRSYPYPSHFASALQYRRAPQLRNASSFPRRRRHEIFFPGKGGGGGGMFFGKTQLLFL